MMRIMEKMARKARNVMDEGGVTVAFLGDSVTQGCFELYRKADGSLETYFDKNAAYHADLARIFAVLFPNVPVNIINAGISGDSAPHAATRLERDVLRCSPDLTVVCFGLNDSGAGTEAVARYTDALRDIFTRLRACGSEIIFMTPNMMATELSCHLTDALMQNVASGCIRVQKEGVLDLYMERARELCREMQVPVCDCYAKWKRMAACGVDTTELLANKINHPLREMNWLFAFYLVETMMEA